MTDKTKETQYDKELREKTDKVIDECVDNGVVPMEHTVVIKFVQKTGLKITKMGETSRDEVLKEITPIADKFNDLLKDWVKVNIKDADGYGLIEHTYETAPYGMKCKASILKDLLELTK